MTSKRLSAAEFEHAVSHLRRSMSETNVSIGRAVIVEGQKQADLAAEHGQSVQAISNIVRRIWKSHVENSVTPEGWERITVCLPAELAKIVKGMERDAMAQRGVD